jgi:hypothetical protein
MRKAITELMRPGSMYLKIFQYGEHIRMPMQMVGSKVSNGAKSVDHRLFGSPTLMRDKPRLMV